MTNFYGHSHNMILFKLANQNSKSFSNRYISQKTNVWVTKAIRNIHLLIKGAEIVYDVFITVYGSRLHLYKISLEMSFDHNSFHLHEMETSKTKVMAINKQQINNRDEFWFRKQHQKANPKHTDYQGFPLYNTNVLIMNELLDGTYAK